MWNYEKRLQYPVHIKTPNAKIAKIILTQYGGPYARNLERFFYLFKCERDLIKKMIQYFSPAGNRGVFIEEKHPEGCFIPVCSLVPPLQNGCCGSGSDFLVSPFGLCC